MSAKTRQTQKRDGILILFHAQRHTYLLGEAMEEAETTPAVSVSPATAMVAVQCTRLLAPPIRLLVVISEDC